MLRGSTVHTETGVLEFVCFQNKRDRGSFIGLPCGGPHVNSQGGPAAPKHMGKEDGAWMGRNEALPSALPHTPQAGFRVRPS